MCPTKGNSLGWAVDNQKTKQTISKMRTTLIFVLLVAFIISYSLSHTLVDCGDEKENKRIGQHYEKNWRRNVQKKNKAQEKCTKTKDAKSCEQVKKLIVKLAYHKKEAHSWKNNCKVLAFRMNRRTFYRYMQEIKQFQKKV